MRNKLTVLFYDGKTILLYAVQKLQQAESNFT